MKNKLGDYGKALAAAYEIFMDLVIAHDLKELKENGYRVMELPLSQNPLAVDKLLILTKDKTIITSVSIVDGEEDFEVKVHTGLETKEVIRSVKLGKGENPSAEKKYLN